MPETRPPSVSGLDIAIDSSSRRWLGTDASGRTLPDRADRAPSGHRLELACDALDLVRWDLADHLVGGRVDDLDAQPLGLFVHLEARIGAWEGSVLRTRRLDSVSVVRPGQWPGRGP